MTRSTTDRIYFIQDKTSGKFLKFGAKVAWATSLAAKNAFNLHMHSYYDKKMEPDRKSLKLIEHLFDKQDDYELVYLDTNGGTYSAEK